MKPSNLKIYIKLLLYSVFLSFNNTAEGQQNVYHLEIGDSIYVKVFSKPLWNDINLEVRNGETYIFSATGEWTDWYIFSDANGYDMTHMNAFRKLRRSPENKWFSLIGNIKDDNTFFLIGKNAIININNTGRLLLFANDVKGFYFNNKGHLQLKIKRVQKTP